MWWPAPACSYDAKSRARIIAPSGDCDVGGYRGERKGGCLAFTECGGGRGGASRGLLGREVKPQP